MAKVIAFYNHKGGVSKTTTVLHLGWKLADIGYKTLLVDADSQCNLTAYALGLSSSEDLLSFYQKKSHETLHDKLAPVIRNEVIDIGAIKPAKTRNKNLYIAAGDIQLSELDIYIAIGLSSGTYLEGTKAYIGAFNTCIRETARLQNFDIVLIDMSPSASAFNRSVLMGSDYFIVPTSPDFFCYQAIQNMKDMLPKWGEDFASFRKAVKNPLPEMPPKFLGVITQRFSVYAGGIAKRFAAWREKIQGESRCLAEILAKRGMSISEEIFKMHVHNENPFNIVSINDFRSLVAVSQKYNKPVFTLSESEVETQGAVLAGDMERKADFDKLFLDLARKILHLTNMPQEALKAFDKLTP